MKKLFVLFLTILNIVAFDGFAAAAADSIAEEDKYASECSVLKIPVKEYEKIKDTPFIDDYSLISTLSVYRFSGSLVVIEKPDGNKSDPFVLTAAHGIMGGDANCVYYCIFRNKDTKRKGVVFKSAQQLSRYADETLKLLEEKDVGHLSKTYSDIGIITTPESSIASISTRLVGTVKSPEDHIKTRITHHLPWYTTDITKNYFLGEAERAVIGVQSPLK